MNILLHHKMFMIEGACWYDDSTDGQFSFCLSPLLAVRLLFMLTKHRWLAYKGIKALKGKKKKKRQIGAPNAAAISGRLEDVETLGPIRPLWTAADARDLGGGVGGEAGPLGLGLTPAFEATNQAVSRIIDGQARTESRLDDVDLAP